MFTGNTYTSKAVFRKISVYINRVWPLKESCFASLIVERPRGAEKLLMVIQFENYLNLSLALNPNIHKAASVWERKSKVLIALV